MEKFVTTFEHFQHSPLCPLCRAYNRLFRKTYYPFPRGHDIRPTVDGIERVARRQRVIQAIRERKRKTHGAT